MNKFMQNPLLSVAATELTNLCRTIPQLVAAVVRLCDEVQMLREVLEGERDAGKEDGCGSGPN